MIANSQNLDPIQYLRAHGDSRDSLTRGLSKHDFAFRTRLVRIIEGIHDDVHHLLDNGWAFYIGVLFNKEEEIHEVATGPQML